MIIGTPVVLIDLRYVAPFQNESNSLNRRLGSKIKVIRPPVKLWEIGRNIRVIFQFWPEATSDIFLKGESV